MLCASLHRGYLFEQGGAFSEGPLTPLVGSGLARELQVEQPAIVVRHRLTSALAFSL